MTTGPENAGGPKLTDLGVIAGPHTASVAETDGDVMLAASDGAAVVYLRLPPLAARHLAERLILNAGSAELSAKLAGTEPCVPRSTGIPNVSSFWR